MGFLENLVSNVAHDAASNLSDAVRSNINATKQAAENSVNNAISEKIDTTVAAAKKSMFEKMLNTLREQMLTAKGQAKYPEQVNIIDATIDTLDQTKIIHEDIDNDAAVQQAQTKAQQDMVVIQRNTDALKVSHPELFQNEKTNESVSPATGMLSLFSLGMADSSASPKERAAMQQLAENAKAIQ